MRCSEVTASLLRQFTSRAGGGAAAAGRSPAARVCDGIVLTYCLGIDRGVAEKRRLGSAWAKVIPHIAASSHLDHPMPKCGVAKAHRKNVQGSSFSSP